MDGYRNVVSTLPRRFFAAVLLAVLVTILSFCASIPSSSDMNTTTAGNSDSVPQVRVVSGSRGATGLASSRCTFRAAAASAKTKIENSFVSSLLAMPKSHMGVGQPVAAQEPPGNGPTVTAKPQPTLGNPIESSDALHWSESMPLLRQERSTIEASGTATLNVTVRGADGNLADQVFLQLFDSSENWIDSRNIGTGGTATFTDLNPGLYKLVATGSGRFTLVAENVTVPGSRELSAVGAPVLTIRTLDSSGAMVDSLVQVWPFTWASGSHGSVGGDGTTTVRVSPNIRYRVSAYSSSAQYYLYTDPTLITADRTITIDPRSALTGTVTFALSRFSDVAVSSWPSAHMWSYSVPIASGTAYSYQPDNYILGLRLWKSDGCGSWEYYVQLNTVVSAGGSTVVSSGGTFRADVSTDSAVYSPGSRVVLLSQLLDQFNYRVQWIRSNGSTIPPTVIVRDPTGAVVHEASSSDLFWSYGFDLPATARNGTYWIQVTYDTGPHQGAVYANTLFCVNSCGPTPTPTAVPTATPTPAADSYEPDNTTAQARWITVGGSAETHNFHIAGDQDWVKFNAQVGLGYRIETSNLGPRCDTVLSLFDVDGTTLLRYNDDYNGLASGIDWAPSRSGSYYVRVNNLNCYTAGSGTQYNLRVASLPCYALTLDSDPSSAGQIYASSDANCGSGAYIEGTQIQLLARPNSGYRFSMWDGSPGGSANPVSLTFDGHKTATARFVSCVGCYPIPVAVFDHPQTADVSYWQGGNMNLWFDVMAMLTNDPLRRFVASRVDSAASSVLIQYDRLLLPDNAIPDSELSAVLDWLTPGKRIVALDSAITYIAYAGLLWPSNVGNNGFGTLWDYESSTDDQEVLLADKITESYAVGQIVSSQQDDAQIFRSQLPADAKVLTGKRTDSSLVYVVERDVPGRGSIVVMGPFAPLSSDLYPMVRSATQGSWTPTPTPTVTVTRTPPAQSRSLYLPLFLRLFDVPWPTPTSTRTPTPVPGDPYEPNNSFDQAWGPLNSGQVYRALIYAPSDVDDFYRFDMPQARTIQVDLWDIPANNDYHLYLYNASRTLVGYSGNAGNAPEQINTANLPPGRYYVRVQRIAGHSATQQYSLRAVYR